MFFINRFMSKLKSTSSHSELSAIWYFTFVLFLIICLILDEVYVQVANSYYNLVNTIAAK